MEDKEFSYWDFIPPERHFNCIEDLRNAFSLYFNMGLNDWELLPKWLSNSSKFEVVRLHSKKGDRKYLWPVAQSYAYLFRGQQEFHYPCLPSLYRVGNLTSEDIFVNQIRQIEFKNLLLAYPKVKSFTDKGYVVDFKGLAQHYGISTDVLDLTSSIDVALFFAMCKYNKDEDRYYPETDDTKEYIGYLYAYPYIFHMMPIPGKSITNIDLMPIGLQPFKRPGAQRGFSLHLKQGQSFVAPIYSFSYTAKDSQAIFNLLKDMYNDDPLSRIVKRINETDTLALDSVREACNKYSKEIFGKALSHTKGLAMLKAKGFVISKDSFWMLDPIDKMSLNEALDNEESAFEASILRRRMISGNEQFYCMDFETLFDAELLSLFKKGCPSLEGYDSGTELFMEGTHVTGFGMHHGREQTLPNPISGRIDKWENLEWGKYELPNVSNRFNGDFPRMKLVLRNNDEEIDL